MLTLVHCSSALNAAPPNHHHFPTIFLAIQGSAMDALAGMTRFLRSRPVAFGSEEVRAVE
jgi:hypothetical protein